MYSSRERLRNQVVSTLIWLWWVIDLPRFEFESRKCRLFYLYLSCVENHVCLSHGMQVIGAAWWVATRIVAVVGELVQKTRDGQAQVGYLVVVLSRGWLMLCAVCTVHMETRSVDFLVEPQNQGRRFLPVWPQNRWIRVSRFGPQNRWRRFDQLGLKIIAVVSWFGPQNQEGYGL
jgi:hypothetical protein